MNPTVFDRELARGSAELLRTKRMELSALEIPAGRGWQPLRDRVTEVLAEHPQSIGAVVAKLVTLQPSWTSCRPARPGTGCPPSTSST